MERRVLFAVFLSILVIYVYQALLPKPVPRPQTPTQPRTGGKARQEPPSDNAPASASTPTPTPPGAEFEPLIGEAVERDVPLETELVSALFTNRGGVLKSWKLKHFRDSTGQLHDLVPQGLAADLARPFRLRLDDEGLTRRLNSALFKVDRGLESTLLFEYQDASGLKARKEFRLESAPYVLSASIAVAAGDRTVVPTVQWGPALGPLRAVGQTSRYVQSSAGIVYRDGEVQRLAVGEIAQQPLHTGTFGFGGVDDQYFLTAIVRPGAARLEYRTVSLPISGDQAAATLVAYDARLDPPRWPQRFFVGPKDFDVLKAVDPDLPRAINFGWFDWAVVPLLRALKWLNSFIGNYGWSIIVLTVLINAVMFPLRHKSVVSMRKMQEIQPEVKAIQDRYAKLKTTDPARQKMNTELMALYRERGVNPASGCIPMLLTMPVLFAFYSLLSVAIELRGAPFILWIRDLSVHDPLYVTPVLMGVTMVVQQKMTPSSFDPVQQKMMMIMPIVFSVMFLWAPSGLVLYWLVSNVWAIGQQMLTNRLIGPPAVRTVRAPAERQLKRAGAGKTGAAEKSE